MAQFRRDTQRFMADSKTLFETVMLADRYGNIVGAANPSGMAVDAFGRARMSTPLTLYDSFHRYQDNGKIGVYTAGGGTSTHDTNSSSIVMEVGTAAGDEVIRETNRVFAYQPGKSLQILLTFVMNAAKTNLRQRAGYFNTQNGFFVQQDDLVTSFVKRSYSTGSLVETVVPQSEWNIDKMDGTGPSGYTLDLSKAQILFLDVEWLGVGSVRLGFVIDGQFIHCHSFHHANSVVLPYMTTAQLPGRIEITNKGITASPSQYRQICFSVISEGGYELRGRPRSTGIPVTAPKDMPVAGTYVPLVSIRLKSTRPDAIVIPKNFSLLGIGNNSRISYKLVASAVLTGAVWTSGGDDSSVEYDISATAYTGGVDMERGYVAISNQSTQTISEAGQFRFQLERNNFTNTTFALTLVATSSTAGDDVVASIDWEEI